MLLSRCWVFMQKRSASTNPKDVVGGTKLPIHLWPFSATMEGSLAMLDGMLKYGRTNWRETPITLSEYVSATLRHIVTGFEGEDADPDSGIDHFAHALATLAIIVDARAHGTLIDDRQFSRMPAMRDLIKKLTPHVVRLKTKHADKNPRHYTIADNKDAVLNDILDDIRKHPKVAGVTAEMKSYGGTD